MSFILFTLPESAVCPMQVVQETDSTIVLIKPNERNATVLERTGSDSKDMYLCLFYIPAVVEVMLFR